MLFCDDGADLDRRQCDFGCRIPSSTNSFAVWHATLIATVPIHTLTFMFDYSTE